MDGSQKSSQLKALQEQMARMVARIYRLEQTLLRHGISLVDESQLPDPFEPHELMGPEAKQQAGKIDTPISPIGPEAAARAPLHPPKLSGMERPRQGSAFEAMSENRAEDRRSLESRIGSQWFNRIGILAVLIGMAWFLKFAIDNHWIGPVGRVLIGLVAGAGLIGWSQWFLAKGYRGFSYSLKAVGSGTLYLALWATFSLYHLIPSTAAFAAMIAVTAFNGYLAWAQDAELLALYAIVGGLSTPLLLSTGENHEVALFSYLLMLDAAVLALTALKSWSRILVTAFIGTALFFVGWTASFYRGDERGTTTAFVLVFFLLFALAPRLVRLREENVASGWDALALAAMPMANAALGFAALFFLLEPVWGEWTGAWLAVGFATFYLALLRAPVMGLLHG
ncbi:MAG TPA: DUF2339 domain-containing protein, partial [Acidobacteriaceae bacterium]